MIDSNYRKIYLFKKPTRPYWIINTLSILIIFIALIVTAETIYYQNLKNKPNFITNNIPKKTTFVVTANDGKQIEVSDPMKQVSNRVETLPEDLRNFISPEIKYPDRITQKTVISNKATVKSIVTKNQSYRLVIDSGQTIIGHITADTFIGDAWFGIDKNNHLFLTQYAKVTKNDISRLKIGDKVNIGFFEQDSNQTEINLLKFVLLE